ncbi:F-box/FBD/LRR-repeat protein At5g18770-like [Raphanus sativus]|uniref:F-box/FBD/LRR-repeat protein At5g18770-like n=1 Tax=Raphanus sativus TaxID=3726 RepID=A0A9W3DFG8_RAPSA|nr:F-box/FBD/LRR-repeat protein At5g18770-like [Raphanus sativus]
MEKFQKRLGVSSSSVREGEDRISLLPEQLLCHILGFLTTEEAVWTSVLSSPWSHLWKSVPRLELDSSSFASDRVCVDFIDEFLAFQGKPYYLREFKLTIDHDVFHSDVSLYEPCLGRVDMRKMERYQVENRFEQLSVDNIATPPLTLSACEALVCLKLHFVRLNEFVSLSLPCLKTMYLEDVVMPSDAAAEALISSSPVLEVLKISVSVDDAVVALRVCSKSLKSFALKGVERFYVRGRYSVLIDAPKLEHLSLMDYYHFKSFKIISAADSFKVEIDVEFVLMRGYLSETKMIYNLVKSFSGVEDMTISWTSLKFIYSSFHQMKRPPKFHDLTVLRATMCLYASPKLLPVVLESCPNLKHLTLELVIDDSTDPVSIRISTVLPSCLVSSLESVEIESPVTEKAIELKLARYFMKNSTTLKKLVLRLNDCTLEPCVLEQLVEKSRRYGLSQFEVIPVVPTPNPWPEGYVYEKSRR